MFETIDFNILKLHSISIRNLLGCKFVRVNVSDETALVIEGNKDCRGSQAISLAVQLIVSGKYATFESLPLDVQHGSGAVSIEFFSPKRKEDCISEEEIQALVTDIEDEVHELDYSPSTSAEAHWREMKRMEDKLERIERTKNYNFNLFRVVRSFALGEVHNVKVFVNDNESTAEIPISRFHGLFQTTIDYLLPKQHQMQSIIDVKWVECIITNCDEAELWYEQPDNPLGRFVMYMIKKMEFPFNFRRFAESFFQGNLELNSAQKENAVQIFGDTRTIFELLTGGKYSVWFMILANGTFSDVIYTPFEHLDLNRIRTYIQLRNQNDSLGLTWQSQPNGIKKLLLIAFQLVLAYHYNLPVVFIDEMRHLEEMQVIELLTIGLLAEPTENGIEESFANKNYLQRIIDVCISMKKQLIITLDGPACCELKNVDIASAQKIESGWQINVTKTESGDIQNLLNILSNRISGHAPTTPAYSEQTEDEEEDEEIEFQPIKNGEGDEAEMAQLQEQTEEVVEVDYEGEETVMAVDADPLAFNLKDAN